MRDTETPQPSFADVELQRQGITLDGTLQAVSDLLDEHGELVERVRQDLVRGLKNPETGRGGLNAQQVLRSFTLKSIKNWYLRELCERITDGITLHLHRLLQRTRSQARCFQPLLQPAHPVDG